MAAERRRRERRAVVRLALPEVGVGALAEQCVQRDVVALARRLPQLARPPLERRRLKPVTLDDLRRRQRRRLLRPLLLLRRVRRRRPLRLAIVDQVGALLVAVCEREGARRAQPPVGRLGLCLGARLQEQRDDLDVAARRRLDERRAAGGGDAVDVRQSAEEEARAVGRAGGDGGEERRPPSVVPRVRAPPVEGVALGLATAIPISSCVAVVASFSSSSTLDAGLAASIAIAVALGAPLGTRLARQAKPEHLKLMIAFFLLVIGASAVVKTCAT